MTDKSRQDLPLDVETSVPALNLIRLEFREQFLLLEGDALIIRIDEHGRSVEVYSQLVGRPIPVGAFEEPS